MSEISKEDQDYLTSLQETMSNLNRKLKAMDNTTDLLLSDVRRGTLEQIRLQSLEILDFLDKVDQ